MKMKLKRMLMKRGASLVLGIALPAALVHGAGQVDASTQEQGVTQQESVEELRVYSSTGPVPDVIKLGIRIQDAALQIKLGTNLKQTEKELNQIWLELATAEPYMQQASSLAALALVRASYYIKVQDFDAARAAAQSSFLTTAHPLVKLKSNRFRGVSEEQLRESSEHRNSLPALKELLLKIRVSGYLEGQQLSRIVSEAYEAGDFARLNQIGLVGYEALEELILRDLNVFPSKGLDPLLILIAYSPERSGKFVSKNFHKGGQLWKRRVFLVLDERANALLAGDTLFEGSYEVAPRYPDWVDVAAQLLNSPEIVEDTIQLASKRLRFGKGYAPMLRALVSAAERYGEDYLLEIFRYANRGVVMDPLLLNAGARSKSKAIRIAVGERLTNTRAPEQIQTLELLATDPDIEVRKAMSRIVAGWAKQGWLSDKFLLRLTKEEDVELRADAISRLKYLSEPVPAQNWRILLRDQSEEVRIRLFELFRARIGLLEPKLLAELSLAFAGDEVPEVYDALTFLLVKAEWVDEYPAMLSALRERLVGERPFAIGPDLFWKLVHSEAISVQFTDWMLSANDEVFSRILERIQDRQGDSLLVSYFLNNEQRVALILRAAKVNFPFAKILTRSSVEIPANLAAVREIAQSPDVSRGLRLRCGVVLSSALKKLKRGEDRPAFAQSASGLRACLVELFSAPEWSNEPILESENKLIGELFDYRDRNACNALVFESLKSGRLTEEMARTLASAASSSSDSFAGLVMPLLERWFDPSRYDRPVMLALSGAYHLGKQAPREYLMRALEQPEYVQAAVHSMCALQSEEFTEVIGEYLTRVRTVDTQIVPAPSTKRMVDALAGIGSDAAVEYLLQGLSSERESVQELCAQALDSIEARRARIVRWEDGLSLKPSRSAALQDLLALLQDENPTARALAVRGVGAFGAVEYIPTLIAMLKDPAQEVREAVVDAVKQLSKLPAPKQIDATLPLDAQKEAAKK